MIKYNDRYNIYCDDEGHLLYEDGRIVATRVFEGRNIATWRDSHTGKMRYGIVARIICDTFNHREREDDVVIHIDGNNLNDKLINLKFVSRSEMRVIKNGKNAGKVISKSGSIIYGAYSLDRWMEGEYDLKYESWVEAKNDGYNFGRIFSSSLYGTRYKSIYWRVEKKDKK